MAGLIKGVDCALTSDESILHRIIIISNYNPVILEGKRAHKNGRRTDIHSEHERESQDQYINGKSHKEYLKPTNTIK